MTDRYQLLSDGIRLMETFCAVNDLEIPEVIQVERKDWKFDACAYYRPTHIKICVPKCAGIADAGMQWSYPGYTVDRTPYGVIAHELGHHADRVRSILKGSYFGDYSRKLRAASGEARLTTYCPNDAEWFAEMFRLFVTNSDLLSRIRPKTYMLLAADFTAVKVAPWDHVLSGAPERTLASARNKIQEALK